MKDHDVYSYGVISTSTLFLLRDQFPPRSGYAELAEKHRSIGGEAANSSIVLARLGLSVKLDGNWINPDEDALFLKDIFCSNNIDITSLSFQSCVGPKEMLVVDSDSRTIFGTYAQLLEEKSWNHPQRIDIEKAQVVCLDPFFGDASAQVASFAQDAGKPIVTVDCTFDDPIFMASDIAIISEEFIGRTYAHRDITAVTHDYKANAKGAVIFTFGHKDIIFGSKETAFSSFTPYQIEPVDTAGAGDSFRAGIIFGLLKNWPTARAVDFASALAAVVCQSLPGVLNSPSYDQVISFLKDHGSTESW